MTGSRSGTGIALEVVGDSKAGRLVGRYVLCTVTGFRSYVRLRVSRVIWPDLYKHRQSKQRPPRSDQLSLRLHNPNSEEGDGIFLGRL
jgi:hypothetical protein